MGRRGDQLVPAGMRQTKQTYTGGTARVTAREGLLRTVRSRTQLTICGWHWEGKHMGAFEDAKGKLKEPVGDVTGSEGLRQEGQARQEKGEEEQAAAKARATAEEHETKAEGDEKREQPHRGPELPTGVPADPTTVAVRDS